MTREVDPNSIQQLRATLNKAILSGDKDKAEATLKKLMAEKHRRHPMGQNARYLKTFKGPKGSVHPRITVTASGLGLELGDYVEVTREPGRIILTAAKMTDGGVE